MSNPVRHENMSDIAGHVNRYSSNRGLIRPRGFSIGTGMPERPILAPVNRPCRDFGNTLTFGTPCDILSPPKSGHWNE